MFLVLITCCSFSGSVVLQWRRFCIFGAKLEDEGEIVFIPYNFIRMMLFVSLKIDIEEDLDRSTKTRDGRNVRDGIVTGCHGFC